MKIKIGEKINYQFIITDKDIEDFGIQSKDRQYIHIDDKHNGNTIFGRKIAHGLLTVRPISYILGILLPSKNEYILIKNINLNFRKPVFPGDKVILEVILLEELPKNNWVVSSKWSVDENVVVDGTISIKTLFYENKN